MCSTECCSVHVGSPSEGHQLHQLHGCSETAHQVCAALEINFRYGADIQDGHEADEVRSKLLEKHINVSVSAIGSTRLDFANRGLQQVVRASVHYYNTEEEIDMLIAALHELQQQTEP